MSAKIYDIGRIYKISSPNTDKIYIGSTIRNLNDRFKQHKYYTNNKEANNYRRVSDVLAFGDAVITELFKFENITLNELHSHEHKVILENKTVNAHLNGDGKKYEADKKRHDKEFTVCCMYCECEMKQRNMSNHIKSMKHCNKKIEVMKHELGPDFNKIKLNGKQCSIA